MATEAPIECTPVELTDEQRSNLTKLAAYLRTLPADYPDFEMSDFVSDHGFEARISCGTAACAVGHGPSAGIAPLPNEAWIHYSRRAFVSLQGDDEAWDWCFAASWSSIDNTAHGAAIRIEFMLEHGVPVDGDFQRWGEAPLCYSLTPAVSA